MGALHKDSSRDALLSDHLQRMPGVSSASSVNATLDGEKKIKDFFQLRLLRDEKLSCKFCNVKDYRIYLYSFYHSESINLGILCDVLHKGWYS